MESDAFLDTHLPGESEAMKKLRADIVRFNLWNRVAAGRLRCTLVTGESGTGKGRLCRLVVQHDGWAREGDQIPTAAFLAAAATNLAVVLLTAVPDTLAESELFGHKKGAYTGADKDRKGVFSDDAIENVMLDEIGDASLTLQGKLLQVIQDGSYRRLGDDPNRLQKSTARILACTHQSLDALVASGRFREDLYWRLVPFQLHLPPLRERQAEIPELIHRMTREHLAGIDPISLGLPENPTFSKSDLGFAVKYHWPGNLRQLSDATLLWLVHRGTVTLEEIAASISTPIAPPRTATIKEILRERIAEVLHGVRPPYPKVGDLLREFDHELKISLYALKEQLPLKRDELQQLFSDQRIEDVRTLISDYRKPSRTKK